MADRRNFRLLVASCLAAGPALVFVSAPEARQRATTSQQMYIVCYEANGAPNADYYSDPFPDTGNFFKFTTDFENFVDATYHAGKHVPTCVYYQTQGQAQTALTQRVTIAKNQVVQTHWKSPDAPNPTPVKSPTTPQSPPERPDKSPYNPNATYSTWAFCWKITGDYTAYFSGVFNADKTNVQGLGNDFGAFVAKTHSGVAGGAECPGRRSQADAERVRQIQIDELKSETPKTRVLKLVDVDWTPAPVATATVPASAGVPSAPPPNTLDAYQKALAAERPSGVAAPSTTETQVTAPATSAAVKPATTRTMFCYGTGSPSSLSGSAPAHAYVTQPFEVSATSAPMQAHDAFQAFLRGAHPDEIIGPVTCPGNTAPATLQQRQTYIAQQRRIPGRTVVELDWKGGR